MTHAAAAPPAVRSRSRCRAGLLVRRASQVVTMAPLADRPSRRVDGEGALGIVEDGAVACAGDRIVAVGRTAEVERLVAWDRETVVMDAAGQAVLPGLVDAHTHAIYAGDRADEWARLLRGESYVEILRAGGGIRRTVEHTRAASPKRLVGETAQRLWRMALQGTTTVEVKSGYALDARGEVALLDAIAVASELVPSQVVPTFMGAHALPPGLATGDADTYVNQLVDVMLPEAVRRGLARFCDVFCERGVFSVEQCCRVLERARELGLGLKVHADQWEASGGTRLAARMRAISAEHLNQAPPEELAELAGAGTVAVLLPGADLFTRTRHLPPVDVMRELGIPMALATDHNPGTSPTESMPLVAWLGCSLLGLTPEEAVAGMTIHGARALLLAHEVGSLEAGKRADLVVLSCPSYLGFPYRMGAPDVIAAVVAAGRVLAGAPALEADGGAAGTAEEGERGEA